MLDRRNKARVDIRFMDYKVFCDGRALGLFSRAGRTDKLNICVFGQPIKNTRAFLKAYSIHESSFNPQRYYFELAAAHAAHPELRDAIIHFIDRHNPPIQDYRANIAATALAREMVTFLDEDKARTYKTQLIDFIISSDRPLFIDDLEAKVWELDAPRREREEEARRKREEAAKKVGGDLLESWEAWQSEENTSRETDVRTYQKDKDGIQQMIGRVGRGLDCMHRDAPTCEDIIARLRAVKRAFEEKLVGIGNMLDGEPAMTSAGR